MKIGVCTWTFGAQPLAITAQQVAERGFDGVELLGDLAQYSAAEAKTILDDAGLDIFSLTPTDADISHPDPTVRGEAVDYYFRLLDFAAELGQPLVSCHGLVGRVAPLMTQQAEDAFLREAVRLIVERAARHDLKLVFEVLNRYETHQIHTGAQALQLVADIACDNFGVLLDAYHMNIEEADPAAALTQAGEALWLYHAADSNRQGIGAGHIDFTAQIAALTGIRYLGPIILECTAAGPNPFTPEKADGWREQLASYHETSIAWLRQQ